MTPMVPMIEKFATHKTNHLAELPDKSMIRIGGLVGAVQKGISKKSNKPYLIATLEDLDGSVQILCASDTYEKFADLFVPNAALLVTGEINKSEDKPKIFPQEIMLSEDAPLAFTKQVHLRLQTAHVEPKDMEWILELVKQHPGKCPLFLCMRQPGGQLVFIETHERYRVKPSMKLQQAVDEKFGEDTYYAKVDNTLPERAARKWEKKSNFNSNGGGE